MPQINLLAVSSPRFSFRWGCVADDNRRHDNLSYTACKLSFIAPGLLRFGTGAFLVCLYPQCPLSGMCIRRTSFVFLLVLNNLIFIITLNNIHIFILVINCFFYFAFFECPYLSTNTCSGKIQKNSILVLTPPGFEPGIFMLTLMSACQLGYG